MARLVRFGEFVGPGEKLTAAYLETKLPSGWVVICNKELVAPDGSTKETDFVIVGQNVVFVLEEKHWSGVIDGDEQRWYARFGPVRSPISANLAAARRLAGILQSNTPGLSDSITGVFTFGRVILSHPGVELLVDEPRVASHVLHLVGCEEQLERTDGAQPAKLSIKPFRDGVLQVLEGLRTRATVPSRIGNYDVIESRGRSGPIQTLLARHDDGDFRLLRLIEQPVTAVTARGDDLRLALLREYDALRTLAARGRTPLVDQYFTWGDDQFWVVPIHLAQGVTLAEQRLSGDPVRSRIVPVAKACFEALVDIHAAGIVHRDINPERVYVGTDGRSGFSDFALARITGQRTIAGLLPVDPAPSYRAPEVAEDLSLASDRTDVYSLAASLCYWVSGEEPDEVGALSGALDRVATVAGGGVESILDRCLARDPNARPDAAAVVAELSTLESPAPTSRSGPATPDELLDGQYRVKRVLGQGATAITYLALDTVSGEQFVLKRITNPEWVQRLARNEFRALLDLDHPCLPKVYDVRIPTAPFHIKLEYVRGSPLRELMPGKRGDLDFAMHVADELLSVLDYLSTRHLIHRDLSPGNILVPDEESGHVRLIDFGVATDSADAVSVVGTPRYRAPEIDRGGVWSEGADLYSLAAILIELLLGRLPYEIENGVASKHRVRPPTGAEVNNFGARVLEVLFRGAAPDAGIRYHRATEFRDALRGALVVQSPVDGIDVINPHVDRLRATYRNSRVGNAENRGLDTEFAVATYVPSRLDRDLFPQIVAGAFRLVVLSGNPGDGKTAFLQQARLRLKELGGEKVDDIAAGWTYRLGDRTIRALYDASESDQGRTADELLEEILGPLAVGASREPYTGLIAVNDGRLLQFIDTIDVGRYAPIRDGLAAQLSGSPARDGVLLVDLKHRSLVSPTERSSGLYDDIVEEFTRPEHWRACEGCVARVECPIRFNALSLSVGPVALKTRQSIGRMLAAVHLRRERRPTFRDLRSALAFIITNDIGCADIHSDRASGLPPAGDGRRLYFNAAFDGSGSPDLVLDEWRAFDPADVSAPALDRYLYFNRTDSTVLARLFADSPDRPPLHPAIGPLDSESQWLGMLKRRYAFEGLSTELGIVSMEPVRLNPYRYFEEFQAALVRPDDAMVGRILRGLSHADGVPISMVTSGLGLTMAETSDGFVVVKVFTGTEFAARPGETSRPFLEVTADSLVLEHVSGTTLAIGLDLYEFLARSADGLVSGSEEQLALAEDVVRFKNELLARPSSEVVLSERGRSPYRAVQADGKISLESA